ncbi:hypothetical protein DRJ04_02835 [Candidatus Aerophobetes bacterium]|uniref:YjgP/YjgQ family permease n=1 Tax=Aerophobetes bacterium TaxID=2030807 RepID=A0A662DFF3_UNCAE|nr:MAG: hypothetical protein DRJ04_02835 [Candidatus Aerophobetes bacterium]
MKVLDRYITREFLRYYFLFVFFFIAVFILTDFFTSMGNLKKEASIFHVVLYYLLQIPYLFVVLSPISVIISTLFVTSYLGSTNQLHAMLISGISAKRATLPLFTAGLVIGFSLLFIDNTLVYEVNHLSHKIKEKNFMQITETKVQKNIFIAVPPDYIFYVRSLNTEEGLMQDVLIYKNSLPNTLTLARRAKWKRGMWLLEEGREYILNRKPKEKPFIKKILPVNKEPRYFTRTYFPPERMSISELTGYIGEYSKSGFNTLDLETELQFKFSSPFANFILMLVTIPLGVIMRRGRGASLATGLLMSFGYYELMALFKTLGKSGVLDPFFSAWIPNILFIMAGIYLIYKME